MDNTPLSNEYFVTDDHLLVKAIINDEKTTPGGLVIKDQVHILTGNMNTPLAVVRGFVVRKGEGYPIFSEKDDLTGTRKTIAIYIPLQVEVGNEVMFLEASQGVFSLTLDGERYYLIRQGHVLIARKHEF